MTWAPPREFGEALYASYGLTCPPRWGTPRHEEFPTFGPAVGRVMTQLGTPPMPWQRYMLDVALEINPRNTFMMKNAFGLMVPQPIFVHREVGLSICRQQGKTVSVLALSAHRLMNWYKQVVTYAAQTRISAREKWEDDFVDNVLGSPLKHKFRARRSSGSEALVCLQTRSQMGITANTEKAGHGDTLDLGLIDEAFSHEDSRLEQAFGPAMITRPMAQKWWLSAGGTERSIFLNRKREVGRQIIEDYWRSGTIQNVAYFEWYPDDDARRDLFETWLTCMPALCPKPPCRCDSQRIWKHTIEESVVRSESITMEEAEFDRAYLNRTKRKTLPPDDNIPVKEWQARVNKNSRRGGDLAIAADITPQRNFGTISVYSLREDGIGHAEIAVHRPGIKWIPKALLRMKEKWNPVAIGLDAVTGSPMAAIKDALLKLGFQLPEDPEKPLRGDLWIPSLAEYVAACGQMVDDIRQGKIEHIDQAVLNVAVGGARTRPLGDAWALARKSALVNISPFVSITIARATYLARVDKIVPDDGDPGIWFVSQGSERQSSMIGPNSFTSRWGNR